MKVYFQMLNLTCVQPTMPDRDTVKFYLVVSSKTGSLDKMESDTEPTARALDLGDYDMAAGQILDLSNAGGSLNSKHPPVGRADWRTNAIEVSETSDVVISLSGIGYFKATLGGGGEDPDSVFGKLMDTVGMAFIKLVPYVGDVAAAAIEFAKKVANADPTKECHGPIFAFSKTYSGADLMFELIKAVSYVPLDFAPADSAHITTTGRCSAPKYAAAGILFGAKPTFETEQHSVEKSTGPEVVVEQSMTTCRSSHQAKCWVVRSDTTVTISPNTMFSQLRYVWKIGSNYTNASQLIQGQSDVDLTCNVVRYDMNNPAGPMIAGKEAIRVTCNVDAMGRLQIHCPETSGSMQFVLSCNLYRGDDKVQVYTGTIKVESEAISGNEAYQQYSDCVYGWWSNQIRQIERISETIRTIPQKVPLSEAGVKARQWQEIVKTFSTVKGQIQKLNAGQRIR